MLALQSKAIAFAAIACCLTITMTARATGTIDIQHKNGTLNTYKDVEVKVLSGSLFVTTHDGQGTMVVTKAACSYQGKIIVCLPSSVAVVQGGSTHALDLKSGTIYVNYTDSAQPLSRSSAKLPAHAIMLSFTTKLDTVVTLRGRLDQVINQ